MLEADRCGNYGSGILPWTVRSMNTASTCLYSRNAAFSNRIQETEITALKLAIVRAEEKSANDNQNNMWKWSEATMSISQRSWLTVHSSRFQGNALNSPRACQEFTALALAPVGLPISPSSPVDSRSGGRSPRAAIVRNLPFVSFNRKPPSGNFSMDRQRSISAGHSLLSSSNAPKRCNRIVLTVANIDMHLRLPPHIAGAGRSGRTRRWRVRSCGANVGYCGR